MPEQNWNESYAAGDPPWDSGQPDDHLMEFVRSGGILPSRAIDLGCGTGTNALWLAGQGFKVVGIDIAPLAVEKARAKAAATNLHCRFDQLDFLKDSVSGGPFDFAYDRGCFHVFDRPEDRARFAQRVAALLEPNGRWLSLIGSTEGPERDWGPPRRSVFDIVTAIEPVLEILEIRSVQFRDLPIFAAAWMCLFRPRSVPAVPSTRRV